MTPTTHQKIPEAWPELLSFTESALDFNAATASQQVVEKACTLDLEALEENAYYGMSLASFGLASALKDPACRAEIVELNVFKFVAGHANYCSTNGYFTREAKAGLRLYEISGLAMGYSMVPLVEQSLQLLTPAQQLLTNALCIAEPGSKDSMLYEAARLSGRAHERLMTNSFIGAATVAKAVFLHTYEQNHTGEKVRDPKLSDVVPRPSLSDPSVIQVATRAAAVHFNSFPNTYKAIKRDPETGNFTFDKAAVANDITVKYPRRRQARIGCPALYIRELIPHVLKTTEETILKADDRLRPHISGSDIA